MTARRPEAIREDFFGYGLFGGVGANGVDGSWRAIIGQLSPPSGSCPLAE